MILSATTGQLLESAPFPNEKALQDAIQKYPSLLRPVTELGGQPAPLFVISRELNLGAGPMDFLAVDINGALYIVETKLARNPELRRTVAGQIIDYAKQLAQTDYAELAGRCKAYPNVQHSLAAAAQTFFKGQNPAAAEMDGVGLSEADYLKAISDNLKAGRFTAIIVADQVSFETQQLFNYLNGITTEQAVFVVLEITCHRSGEAEFYQSNVVWGANYIKQTARKRREQEAEFLKHLSPHVRRLLDVVDEAFVASGIEKVVYPDSFSWKGEGGGSVYFTTKELRVNWTTLKDNPALESARLAVIKQAQAEGYELIGGASSGPKLKLTDTTPQVKVQRFLEMTIPVIKLAAQLKGA